MLVMYYKYYLCANERTQEQYKLIKTTNTLSDLLHIYGETIYLLSPYKPYVIYNNFYFILRYFYYLKYTITNVYVIDNIINNNYY
jgi:hypothetical protein